MVRPVYTSFKSISIPYIFSIYGKASSMEDNLPWSSHAVSNYCTPPFSAPPISTNIDLLQLGFLGHRGLETVTAFVLINLLDVLRGWVNVQPLITNY